MLLLFIPIGIMVDVAEKIDKFKEKEIPMDAIIEYYINFTWYFGNLLYPVFIFLAIIWFTSKFRRKSSQYSYKMSNYLKNSIDIPKF